MTIEHDMREHFATKLRTLVIDTADTCERAEVPMDDVLNFIVTELMQEMLLAVLAAGVGREPFVEFCHGSYDKVLGGMYKMYDKQQRRAH